MTENNITPIINFLTSAARPVLGQRLDTDTNIARAIPRDQNWDALRFTTKFLVRGDEIADARLDIKKAKSISDTVVEGWGTVDGAQVAERENINEAKASDETSTSELSNLAVDEIIEDVLEQDIKPSTSVSEEAKATAVVELAVEDTKNQAWDELGAEEA